MSTYDPEERRAMASGLEYLRDRNLDLSEEVDRLRQERKMLLDVLSAARKFLESKNKRGMDSAFRNLEQAVERSYPIWAGDGHE